MDRNANYYCIRTSHGNRMICHKYSEYLRVRQRHLIADIQLVTNSEEEAWQWYDRFISVMREDNPQGLVCSYEDDDALRMPFAHPRALQSAMN